VKGGVTILRSIRLLDEADQAQDIDIIFMNATGTLGTINNAFSRERVLPAASGDPAL
jgi:hypothetical protein